MAALPTLASVKGLFERTLPIFAASKDTRQYEQLAVTCFWEEGRRDQTSLVEAERVITASMRRSVGCYRLSSRQGGAMLLRSISSRPVNPYLKGDWDCWLVPGVFAKGADLAARIGKAAAAMKKTTLVTVQLGHRVVMCEGTFLLASISTVMIRY